MVLHSDTTTTLALLLISAAAVLISSAAHLRQPPPASTHPASFPPLPYLPPHNFSRSALRRLLQDPPPPSTVTVALALNTSQPPILLSSDGSYSFQFLPYRNATLRLLAVVNTQFNTTTVVWIANRSAPVSPTAALLFAMPSRQFLLQNDSSAASSVIAWSSPAGVHAAELNISGNLILRDSNGSILWQSFDYPTDTMVAGQFLGTHKTLISSISDDDLSEGSYRLTVEAGGIVFYADLGGATQIKVPYHIVAYSYAYAGSGEADASGSGGGNLSEALRSACNKTYIVYSSNGVEISLKQEGDVITPQCAAEVQGYTVHGITFTTMTGGVSGFRYLRLMPDGDVQTFLISDTTGLVPVNEPNQGFFSTYCKLPSYCGINSLCSGYDSCSCPDADLFVAMDPAASNSSSAQNGFGGCALRTPLDCSSASHHQFLEISAADYFANAYHPNPLPASSAANCQLLCLRNCSCSAAFLDNSTATCYLYDQIFTIQSQSNPSLTAFLRVAHLPPSAAAHSADRNSNRVIIGASAGASAALAVLLAAALAYWISKRPAPGDLEDDSEEEAFLQSLPGLPPRFSYADLHSATEGFSKKLGSGASGAVYEGLLRLPNANLLERGSRRRIDDSSGGGGGAIYKAAVKQLHVSSRSSTIGTASKKHFRAEVATMCGVSHVNLVQLIGFCAEAVHRLLVYEHMENGSLDRWIFSGGGGGRKGSSDDDDKEDGREIDKWEVRYRIAVDMARGLAFLHEGCRNKILHLDVKPQNVLLDGNFRAKLSDFGGSKLIERERGKGDTQTVTAMRGTPGYMAPEWFLNLAVTDKSDVFSYGMVLLELVGGRKNVEFRCGGADDGEMSRAADGGGGDEEDEEDEAEEWYFPAIVAKQVANGNNAAAIADRKMLHRLMSGGGGGDKGMQESAIASLNRLIHVALWCIQQDAVSRPSMSTVLLMLEEHVQVPSPPLHLYYVPRQRHLQRRHSQSSAATFNTTSSGRSVISASLSVLPPR